jgi:hypothetical protein
MHYKECSTQARTSSTKLLVILGCWRKGRAEIITGVCYITHTLIHSTLTHIQAVLTQLLNKKKQHDAEREEREQAVTSLLRKRRELDREIVEVRGGKRVMYSLRMDVDNVGSEDDD